MNAINITKGPIRASTPNAERRTPNAFSPPFPDPIRVIRSDLVLVDHGPMTLTVSAWADGKARPVMAARAAVLALEILDRLAAGQPLLKTPVGKIKKLEGCPPLLQKAVRICRKISPELTGTAAVAGLAADEVLNEALRLGADRVIVNNGGDIALFTSGRQSLKVGLKTHPDGQVTHYLKFSSGDRIGGVATSGWTGRSFSTGVADVVTVWAGDCTTADVAATWIAGWTDLNSGKVFRIPARELDPETDIPLLEVTREVGRLAPKEKRLSIDAGLAEAERLVAKGVIRGAFLAVQGETRWIGLPGGPEPRALPRK
jgi:ApbE superfamily uncharacterized protein (UPF0280 family)